MDNVRRDRHPYSVRHFRVQEGPLARVFCHRVVDMQKSLKTISGKVGFYSNG